MLFNISSINVQRLNALEVPVRHSLSEHVSVKNTESHPLESHALHKIDINSNNNVIDF